MQQRQTKKVTFWELFVVAELLNNLLTIAQRQGIGTRQIEMKSNSTSSSSIKQLQAKSPNGMCQSVCVGVCECFSLSVSLPLPFPISPSVCLPISLIKHVEQESNYERLTHITPVDICTEVSYGTAGNPPPLHTSSVPAQPN